MFSAVAFNQPKLPPNACWNSDAITAVNNTLLGYYSGGFFLTKNNTWYVVTSGSGNIRSGTEGSANPMVGTLSGYSIFVAGDNNVYTYDSSNYQVIKLSMGMSISQPVMFMTGSCQDLFVDTNSTLYCSLYEMSQVVSKSLNDPTNTMKIVAGTGCYGSASNMLYSPNGIFVDFNFTLYVADSNNNRIQRFGAGQMNAATVAGNGAPGTITLNYPTDIILDDDGYLFIVDRYNHRIVGSGPDGFRCVAGCSGISGSASNQLYYPQGMAFDSYGNIWVADGNNYRIQKFVLTGNSYGEHPSRLYHTKESQKPPVRCRSFLFISVCETALLRQSFLGDT